MKLKELYEDVTIENGNIRVSAPRSDLQFDKRTAGWGDIVDGNFSCASNNFLISLKGAPKIIKGTFSCYDCRNLVDISEGPEEVVDYIIWGCGLSSYHGVAKKIGNESAEKWKGWLNIYKNPRIKDFKGIGSYFKGGWCHSIKIPGSLESHILGVLQIPKLGSLILDTDDTSANTNLAVATQIINKHLKSGRDIMDCKEDLMDAGLKEYAKL